MTDTFSDKPTQAEYWNDQAGPKWVRHADELDMMLSPFHDKVLKRAKIRASDRVLDIGCGAGSLSLSAAKKAAQVTGVDISQPLLGLARERGSELENLNFVRANAAEISPQVHGPFDIAMSRFGVMFFEDPVAAFTQIASVMSKSASLVFACWREPQFNPWATLPMQVAAPLMDSPPAKPDPDAPGPFAFADRSRIRTILQDAGWPNIEINSYDVEMVLPGNTPEESAAFMMEMGPLSKIMKEQELDFAKVQSALISKLKDNANTDGTVDLQGSVWIVEASRN